MEHVVQRFDKRDWTQIGRCDMSNTLDSIHHKTREIRHMKSTADIFRTQGLYLVEYLKGSYWDQ